MAPRKRYTDGQGREWVPVSVADNPIFARRMVEAWSAHDGGDRSRHLAYESFDVPAEVFDAVAPGVRAQLGPGRGAATVATAEVSTDVVPIVVGHDYHLAATSLAIWGGRTGTRQLWRLSEVNAVSVPRDCHAAAMLVLGRLLAPAEGGDS